MIAIRRPRVRADRCRFSPVTRLAKRCETLPTTAKCPPVVLMWSSCGPHVVLMWSSCGPHVVLMWSSCGPHVVLMWSSRCHTLPNALKRCQTLPNAVLVSNRADYRQGTTVQTHLLQRSFLPHLESRASGPYVRRLMALCAI
jgi:hypothetical protein